MGLRLLNGAPKPAYDGLQAADLGLRQGRERDRLRPGPAGRQRHARRPSTSRSRRPRARRSRPCSTVPVTSANGIFTASVPELGRRSGACPGTGSRRARRRCRLSEAARSSSSRSLAARARRRRGAGARRRLRARHGGRGPAPLQPAARRCRGRSTGAELGVDVVRIHARWWEIAPQTDAATQAGRLQRRQTPTTRATTGRRSTTRSTRCAAPGCG